MPITNISMSQAKELVSQNANIIVLDVRSPMECAGGVIPNAIQNDIMDVNAFLTRAQTYNKNGEFLLYCRSGGRSRLAADMLSKQGFEHIYNCTEGYSAY